MSLDRPAAARLLLRRAAPPAPDGTIVDVTVDSAGLGVRGHRRLSPAARAVRRPRGRRPRAARARARGTRRRARPGDLDFGTLGIAGVGVRRPAGARRPRRAGSAVSTIVAGTDALVVVAAAPGGAVRRTGGIAAGGRPRRGPRLGPAPRGASTTCCRPTPRRAGSSRTRCSRPAATGRASRRTSTTPRTRRSSRASRSSTSTGSRGRRASRSSGSTPPDRTLDETLAPGDGDVVLVPRGYHPVGVPAGYDCYYLNIMAGPTRAWHFTLDPDHAWLMDWDPRHRWRTEEAVGMTLIEVDSPLQRMVDTTPTDYWNDSCAIAELEYAVERGGDGRDLEPGHRRRGHEEGAGALGAARRASSRPSTRRGPRSTSRGR